MGRPAVLRLVLITTGRPVRCSKPSSIRATNGSLDGSTDWIRAVPSTWTAAGIRSRQPSATSWTKSMYGDGMGPRENSSEAREASTMGATGRNCSRPFTSLRRRRLLSRPG